MADIRAKEEPTPRVGKPKVAPRYFCMPRDTFRGITESIQRKIIDNEGYFDSRTNRMVPCEITYTFLKGSGAEIEAHNASLPTPVWKDSHADMLLDILADSGIYEVAVEQVSDKVEHFYKENNRQAFLATGDKYDHGKTTEIKTPRWRPVVGEVLQTGKEFVARRDNPDEKISMKSLLGVKPKGSKGKKE